MEERRAGEMRYAEQASGGVGESTSLVVSAGGGGLGSRWAMDCADWKRRNGGARRTARTDSARGQSRSGSAEQAGGHGAQASARATGCLET